MYMLLHLVAHGDRAPAGAHLPFGAGEERGSAFVVAIVFSVLNFFFGWLIRVACSCRRS